MARNEAALKKKKRHVHLSQNDEMGEKIKKEMVEA